MRIKKKAFLLCVFLVISGCGKNKEKSRVENAWQDANWTFTDDGILYRNPNPPGREKVEYLDYETGIYMPLCSKANCTHDNQECMAVYLKNVDTIGRIGNKWYYEQNSKKDGVPTFYCCDLNGENEEKLGEFLYGDIGSHLFFDNSCVTVVSDVIFDEKDIDGEEIMTSTVYQYYFDKGKAEVLCPEIKDGYYELYGKYKNQLVYQERKNGKGILKILDLESHQIREPLGDMNITVSTSLNDHFFACTVAEGDIRKLIEIDLESGEWREVIKQMKPVTRLFWSTEMKIITFSEENEGGYQYQTYQCLDDGKQILIREEDDLTYREVLTVKDDLVIGQYYGNDLLEGQFSMATMKKEDYLAGKENWTVLKY